MRLWYGYLHAGGLLGSAWWKKTQAKREVDSNAFATEASADPTGSSGVKRALQSCTGLRQGASPLHQQLQGAGCPWAGAKSWVSQTRAIPKVELSYEPSQQWDGAQLPSSSGSKFDHTSDSPGTLGKASRADSHTQSFWFSKSGLGGRTVWETAALRTSQLTLLVLTAQNHCLCTNAGAWEALPCFYTFSSMSQRCESSFPTAGMCKES